MAKNNQESLKFSNLSYCRNVLFTVNKSTPTAESSWSLSIRTKRVQFTTTPLSNCIRRATLPSSTRIFTVSPIPRLRIWLDSARISRLSWLANLEPEKLSRRNSRWSFSRKLAVLARDEIFLRFSKIRRKLRLRLRKFAITAQTQSIISARIFSHFAICDFLFFAICEHFAILRNCVQIAKC